MYAYLGCRTTRERNARGAGISVFKVDPASARLELAQVLDGLVNPSYLALNARGDRLYAVHGDTTGISAYVVDQGDGRIRPLNRQDTGGLNPVHLAIDPTGRHVIVSNHIGASVAVLPIGADGELGPASQLLPLEGTPGPHRIEQKQAKPHANPFAPDGRHVIVPDKGLDRIFSFRWTDGLLTAAASPVAVAREGAGPRHLAFHPAASHAYCVNELDSSVTVYRYDAASGALEPMQILPSVPDTHTGNNRAAAILVDAGRTRMCRIAGTTASPPSGWTRPAAVLDRRRGVRRTHAAQHGADAGRRLAVCLERGQRQHRRLPCRRRERRWRACREKRARAARSAWCSAARRLSSGRPRRARGARIRRRFDLRQTDHEAAL